MKTTLLVRVRYGLVRGRMGGVGRGRVGRRGVGGRRVVIL